MKTTGEQGDLRAGWSLTDKDFASMAIARSGMYDFLAGLCTKPSREMVAAILNHSFDIPNVNALPAELRKALEALKEYRPIPSDGDLETSLQVEWTKLFRGVAKGYSPPPPYESVYREGVLHGRTTRTVVKTYVEHGLELSKDSRELPDYIAVELKFMSTMASKEAEAWNADRVRAQELIRAQRQFALEHLQSWIPRFCAEATKLATTDFYKAVIQLIRSTVEWDVSLLGSIEESASSVA